MGFRTHLLDTFAFNGRANRAIIQKRKQMPGPAEAILPMRHLINCPCRWTARIEQAPNSRSMDCWEPLYTWEQLEAEWAKSLQPRFDHIRDRSPERWQHPSHTPATTPTDGGQPGQGPCHTKGKHENQATICRHEWPAPRGHSRPRV